MMKMTPMRKRLVAKAAVQGTPSARPTQLRYDHDICCSVSRYKPPGSSGCPCLRWLALGDSMDWKEYTRSTYVKSKSDI